MGETIGGCHHIFLGTYTRGTSRGIYSVTLDGATGALGAPELAAETPNPTFLAVPPNREFLYAVCSGAGWASSYRIEAGGRRLSPIQLAVPDDTPTPCHIAVDATGRIAVAANYHLALAAAIPLGADGSLGKPRVVAHSGKGPDPTRQATAHVHSTNIAPDSRYAIVCDLGLDRIYSYAIDRQAVCLAPAAPPFVSARPRSGPRHLTFAKSGLQAYAINELDNTIVVYGYDPSSGSLAARQTVSVLPPGYSGEATSAEVCVHPDGRFLYGSSRGPDTLAVFAVDGATGSLAAVEHAPCGGKGPRSFSISPDGAWLVCAHQDSGTVCVFQIDPASGRLRRIPGTAAVSMPVCVLFVD
jgi:6-phosphogluconolactonase